MLRYNTDDKKAAASWHWRRLGVSPVAYPVLFERFHHSIGRTLCQISHRRKEDTLWLFPMK